MSTRVRAYAATTPSHAAVRLRPHAMSVTADSRSGLAAQLVQFARRGERPPPAGPRRRATARVARHVKRGQRQSGPADRICRPSRENTRTAMRQRKSIRLPPRTTMAVVVGSIIGQPSSAWGGRGEEAPTRQVCQEMERTAEGADRRSSELPHRMWFLHNSLALISSAQLVDPLVCRAVPSGRRPSILCPPRTPSRPSLQSTRDAGVRCHYRNRWTRPS